MKFFEVLRRFRLFKDFFFDNFDCLYKNIEELD